MACYNDQSDEIVQFLATTYPKAIQEHCGRIDEPMYPLQYACKYIRCCSESMIRYFIQEYPSAVRRKATCGSYPLHFACRTKQSESILRLLLEEYPDAQYQEDNDGWRPVEVFAERRCNIYSWLMESYIDETN
jgi:hypothetical protein